jgi:hypothetical protein
VPLGVVEARRKRVPPSVLEAQRRRAVDLVESQRLRPAADLVEIPALPPSDPWRARVPMTAPDVKRIGLLFAVAALRPGVSEPTSELALIAVLVLASFRAAQVLLVPLLLVVECHPAEGVAGSSRCSPPRPV